MFFHITTNQSLTTVGHSTAQVPIPGYSTLNYSTTSFMNWSFFWGGGVFWHNCMLHLPSQGKIWEGFLFQVQSTAHTYIDLTEKQQNYMHHSHTSEGKWVQDLRPPEGLDMEYHLHKTCQRSPVALSYIQNPRSWTLDETLNTQKIFLRELQQKCVGVKFW